MGPLTAQEWYIQKRNALIPLAECYANEQIGSTGPIGDAENKDWVCRWNREFLAQMQHLARREGLIP